MRETKYQHENETKIQKAQRILKEEGITGFLEKVAEFIDIKYNEVFAKDIIEKNKGKKFSHQNKELEYFYHPYNITWRNERIIEVPIVLHELSQIDKQSNKILEVGAVLQHYTDTEWDVLDKFETADNIKKEDITTYNPEQKYDFVMSISTIEHVGYDDSEKDEKGVEKAIKNIKENILSEKGKAIITLPYGYNPAVEEFLENHKEICEKITYLQRQNNENEWKEVTEEELKGCKYGQPHNAANGIAIIELKGKKTNENAEIEYESTPTERAKISNTPFEIRY